MKTYTGEHLEQIAFPLGGMGAGMFCIEGTGAFTQFSLRHAPNLNYEPNIFAALTVTGKKNISRVLEGPVPRHKIWNGIDGAARGGGLGGTNYGLPRFRSCEFEARFPFAQIKLSDDKMPVTAQITGWSPFIPGDADNSGFPCATVEYAFANASNEAQSCVFYFCSQNIVKSGKNGGDCVAPFSYGRHSGFMLAQDGSEECPHDEGYMIVAADAPDAAVNTAWFRGGWFDSLTMLWNDISEGQCRSRMFSPPDVSGGGTIAVPLSLAPGEIKTVTVNFAWYVPASGLRAGGEAKEPCCGDGCACSVEEKFYKPWYASRFDSCAETFRCYADGLGVLRERSKLFSDTLYASNVPDEITDAVAANLCILKSPTVLRQHDGRLWGWEGCGCTNGCCHGSCTHVWNYAQAVCKLFPKLERGMRVTEFIENQDADGHQTFRASLPLRPAPHDFHAAADGQLGGVIKAYRDWRICGNLAWIKRLWPKIKASLDYCAAVWDPDGEGVIRMPHHNTYDIEFFGPEPMCTTMYLGALKAAEEIADALGDGAAQKYRALRERGAEYVKNKLFNGEYLVQEMDFSGIDLTEPPKASFDRDLSNEARELIKKEGPKYQYGSGCLSDGVIGAWLANLAGLGDIMDPVLVSSHLKAIYKYNFKTDLHSHANPQRPGFALGSDGGLLLCGWPDDAKIPALPFVYSNEVWTGIEYQVASHMISAGLVDEGLQIVRACRARFDGKDRNPYNEYECGHWYARALASFSLLDAYTGARYDKAAEKFSVKPPAGGDASALFCFDGGYGTAGIKDCKAFYIKAEGETPPLPPN